MERTSPTRFGIRVPRLKCDHQSIERGLDTNGFDVDNIGRSPRAGAVRPHIIGTSVIEAFDSKAVRWLDHLTTVSSLAKMPSNRLRATATHRLPMMTPEPGDGGAQRAPTGGRAQASYTGRSPTRSRTLSPAASLPPGSRLPAERELSMSLGVSRASVREAIISLSEIGGLVEVRVGTGILATAPAAQGPSADAGPGPFELLNARKLVEGEIAALAADTAKDSDIDALRPTVERMESHVDDFATREAADRDFHLRIAKATGNSSLDLVVEGLWN